MRILFLGYEKNRLIDFLQTNNEVFQTSKRTSFEQIEDFGPELIISYGYRHIIKGKVLQRYKDRIINLHTSYLPWNSGAYPNIWSIIDDRPETIQ